MSTNPSKGFWLKESIKDKAFEEVYSLGKDLGKGSTACVHKCEHIGTKQPWAAKIIRKNVQKKIVLTEIGILLKLKHPNVVRLKEVYETNERIILILELVTGGELFDRIVTRGHYSEQDAAKAVYDVLTSVAYLHENGVAHRDLKPENILYEDLRENSALKIADFGLSQIIGPEVKMSTICGTPGYCAPEILKGQEYDKSVDIWSIGVIVYILLSGLEPFYDKDDRKLYKLIIKGTYSFPSPMWDTISINAKDLITNMLSLDPKKRLTARQALNHPWVKGTTAKRENLEGAIENIKEFNARRKLKQATEAAMAISKITQNIPKDIFSAMLGENRQNNQKDNLVVDVDSVTTGHADMAVKVDN